MPTLLLWEDDAGATVSVRFDVVFTESHELTAEITEHPVEEGQAVVDNVRQNPPRFSIVGFVSNHPLPSNPGVEDIVTLEPVELEYLAKPNPFASGNITLGVTAAIGNLVNPLPKKATVWHIADFKNRVREMHELLEDAWANARVLRVSTALREYENMVIERLAPQRAPDDGHGATFPLDLKNIRRVKSKTVDAPLPTEPRGQLIQSKGSKSTEAAKNDDKKAAQQKSLAAKIFDGSGSVLGNLF